MKAKLSLTIIYIVLIIYFKVKLPEYTVAELEHDLKVTLYACYSDTLVPLWRHFMYDIDSTLQNDGINHRGNDAESGEYSFRKKQTEDKSGNKRRNGLFSTSSSLEHFDSWKIQDDLRIHPIDDTGPLKSDLDCDKNQAIKTRKSKQKEGIRKLEDDIVVTTIQILNSNIAVTKTHSHSQPPSTVEPQKENKSSTQFGEYVPSIQEWEDKSRTKATRPPTCNC